MNLRSRFLLVVGLSAAALLSACGPGQMFGPTLTPTPTNTASPTATSTPTLTPLPTATPTLTPVPPTATSIPSEDRDGKSFETAIIIQADDEFSGIAMEYQWLAEHYPGYERGSQSVSYEGELIYDLLTITTAGGSKLTIYFDITAFYGKL